MLAYLFWHRPAEGTDREAYEEAQQRFHRSLAARPPDGFRGSACFAAADVRWLDAGGAGYEDWYLVDDWAALGVLRHAAIGTGHRTAHDAAARWAGAGTGSIYQLDEGLAGFGEPSAGVCTVWVTPARHGPELELVALLLGDGMDRRQAGLWRRELALGPAPEYCLVTHELPAGVAHARLPSGWHAESQTRTAVWAGDLRG